ncbi:MAG TPA: hypothetical protein VN445_11620 [Rectinemataceae bacterium]|nr:hypothetical protein [Rectinemataceae bacterium]
MPAHISFVDLASGVVWISYHGIGNALESDLQLYGVETKAAGSWVDHGGGRVGISIPVGNHLQKDLDQFKAAAIIVVDGLTRSGRGRAIDQSLYATSLFIVQTYQKKRLDAQRIPA